MQNVSKASDSPKSLIVAMELNSCSYKVNFLQKLPMAQLVHSPEITYISTGIHDQHFNYVCRTRTSPENVSQVVTNVIAYFKQDEIPFSWCIGPSSQPEQLEKEIKKQGLLLEEDLVGMMLNLERYEDDTEERELLQVNRCLSSEALQDFGYIQREVYDTVAQSELWARLLRAEWQISDALELYVGYHHGEPVTAGILFLHGGVAGIYNVATLPHEQGNRYGTSMIRHLLQHAQSRDYHVAMLQTPQKTIGLFQRLGFTSLCMFRVYVMQWNRQHYQFRR